VTRGTTICCSLLALVTTAMVAKGRPEPLALVPMRPVWTLALNSHITLPPAYEGSRGFFALEENRLVAYDLDSGQQLWLTEAQPLFQPIASGDFLFIVEADSIVALKASDGTAAWKTPLAENLANRPSESRGLLVSVTKTGLCSAVRSSDGTPLWQRTVDTSLHGPVTIAADRVYLPMSDGRVVALDSRNGEPVWERRIGGLPNQILALDDRLFVGSTDNFFYCLLSRDGKIDWRWRTGADVTFLPAADDNRVYFVSFDNVLRALNRTSGGQLWMRALPLRPTAGPLLAGGTLVVAGQSATIRTFDAKSGAPTTDIAAGDDVAAPPYSLPQAVTGLPALVFVTRKIGRGDTVALNVRSVDPIPSPIAPLPNAVTPAPTLPTSR
jgi:outer membrane protein assembly factor BamB